MRAGALVALSIVCLVTTVPAAVAQPTDSEPPLEVSISRSEVSTRLGDSFSFTSTVRNVGTKPLSGLVAHLNVVGLSSGIYVDPEDWSEERTKDVASLVPGESSDITWTVKAVTGGEAAIYVVALPGRDPASSPDGLAVSPALDVSIAETKDLNSGGVLPLALGVPAFLGLTALVVRRRRRP
jgi:uncharacterized membrane protein